MANIGVAARCLAARFGHLCYCGYGCAAFCYRRMLRHCASARKLFCRGFVTAVAREICFTRHNRRLRKCCCSHRLYEPSTSNGAWWLISSRCVAARQRQITRASGRRRAAAFQKSGTVKCAGAQKTFSGAWRHRGARGARLSRGSSCHRLEESFTLCGMASAIDQQDGGAWCWRRQWRRKRSASGSRKRRNEIDCMGDGVAMFSSGKWYARFDNGAQEENLAAHHLSALWRWWRCGGSILLSRGSSAVSAAQCRAARSAAALKHHIFMCTRVMHSSGIAF